MIKPIQLILQVQFNLSQVSYARQYITSIKIHTYSTGCFNLDPNRVLDIILESFENKPKDAKIFVSLINSYMNDPQIVCEVLSTKLAFLKNNQQDVPQSLYILIAQLLQHKIIKLDDIYCWVSNFIYNLFEKKTNSRFNLYKVVRNFGIKLYF